MRLKDSCSPGGSEEGPLQLKSLRRGRCGGGGILLNPREEHFLVQDPAFTHTDALYSTTGITWEVSEKEEEHPRKVFLSWVQNSGPRCRTMTAAQRVHLLCLPFLQ